MTSAQSFATWFNYAWSFWNIVCTLWWSSLRQLNSPNILNIAKLSFKYVRHVFDKISSKFRWISWIYLNFTAPQPQEVSEALFLGNIWSQFWFMDLVLRVIYLINLTGQKQYVVALEWIWPVMVSGDSPEIISSLVLLYLEITRPKHQKSNKNKCQLAIKEQTQP